MSELEIGQPVVYQDTQGATIEGEITAISHGLGAALVFSESQGHTRRGLGPIGDLIEMAHLSPLPESRVPS